MMTINDIRDELIKYNKETRIRVSNGTYIIDNFGSDRGNYYDMYLGFTLNKDKTTINSVDDLLKLLNKAVKKALCMAIKVETLILQEIPM